MRDPLKEPDYEVLLVVPLLIDEPIQPVYVAWRLAATGMVAEQHGIDKSQVYVLTSQEVQQNDLNIFEKRTVVMGVMADTFPRDQLPVNPEPMQAVTGEFKPLRAPRLGIFPERTAGFINTVEFDVVLIAERRQVSYWSVDPVRSQRTNSLTLNGLYDLREMRP